MPPTPVEIAKARVAELVAHQKAATLDHDRKTAEATSLAGVAKSLSDQHVALTKNRDSAIEASTLASRQAVLLKDVRAFAEAESKIGELELAIAQAAEAVDKAADADARTVAQTVLDVAKAKLEREKTSSGYDDLKKASDKAEKELGKSKQEKEKQAARLAMQNELDQLSKQIEKLAKDNEALKSRKMELDTELEKAKARSKKIEDELGNA